MTQLAVDQVKSSSRMSKQDAEIAATLASPEAKLLRERRLPQVIPITQRAFGKSMVATAADPVKATVTLVDQGYGQPLSPADLGEVWGNSIGSPYMTVPEKQSARVPIFQALVAKLGGVDMGKDQATALIRLLVASRLDISEKQMMISHLGGVIGQNRRGLQSDLHQAIMTGLPTPEFLNRLRFGANLGLRAMYIGATDAAAKQRAARELRQPSPAEASAGHQPMRLAGLWSNAMRPGVHMSATRKEFGALANDLKSAGLKPPEILKVCIEQAGQKSRIQGRPDSDKQYAEALRGMTQGLCDSLGAEVMIRHAPLIASDLHVERDATALATMRHLFNALGHSATHQMEEVRNASARAGVPPRPGGDEAPRPDFSLLDLGGKEGRSARLALVAAFDSGRREAEGDIFSERARMERREADLRVARAIGNRPEDLAPADGDA